MYLCSLIPATVNYYDYFLVIKKKKTEIKTDHKYLPKFTCLVNRVGISNPALALKCLLLKPQNNAGSLKRKYIYHCNFAI